MSSCSEERSHRKDGGGPLVAVQMTCFMFLVLGVFGLMFCPCVTVQVQIIRSGIDINERLKEPPGPQEVRADAIKQPRVSALKAFTWQKN